jgi:hypothetical protein
MYQFKDSFLFYRVDEGMKAVDSSVKRRREDRPQESTDRPQESIVDRPQESIGEHAQQMRQVQQGQQGQQVQQAEQVQQVQQGQQVEQVQQVQQVQQEQQEQEQQGQQVQQPRVQQLPQTRVRRNSIGEHAQQVQQVQQAQQVQQEGQQVQQTRGRRNSWYDGFALHPALRTDPTNVIAGGAEDEADRGSNGQMSNGQVGLPHLLLNVWCNVPGVQHMRIIAEIQIHYGPVLEIGKGDHKLYEIVRAKSMASMLGTDTGDYDTRPSGLTGQLPSFSNNSRLSSMENDTSSGMQKDRGEGTGSAKTQAASIWSWLWPPSSADMAGSRSAAGLDAPLLSRR